jgi:hypothetical protein
MKLSYARRYRRSTSSTRENAIFKKDTQQEHAFFAAPSNQSFFKPAAIQRKCAHCEAEDKQVNRQPAPKEEEKKVNKKGEDNHIQRQAGNKEEEKKIQKVGDKKEEEKKVQLKQEGEEQEAARSDKKEEEKKRPDRLDNKEEEKKIHKMGEKKEEDKLPSLDEKKEEEKKIPRKESVASVPEGASTGAYITSLGTKGQHLPAETQHFFGERMGHDFGDVKIHTGTEAEQSSKEINAKAYTVDNHIVFNKGQYNPNSGDGKKLLAHELTHVMQQRGDSPHIQRQAPPAPALTSLSVANATPVAGHLTDQFVSARNSPSGQVIVNANVTNVPAGGLAANVLKWQGGVPGPTPQQRLVRVSSAGEFVITATLNGVTNTLRVFIVNSPPSPPSAGASQALLQHILAGAANPGTNFGLTVVTIGQQGVKGPEFTINPFLNGDHWEFRVADIKHRYKLGITAGSGLTNITGPNDGHIKPSNVCNIITDLTPPAPGTPSGPPRASFWSKSITTAHEHAHVDRFYSAAFWEAQMRLFEAFVAGLSVPFTSALQSPGSVLTAQQPTFRTQVDTLHAAADALEITGAEVACHGVSNPMYTQLITGIRSTAVPPTPTGLAASAITQNSVSLSWAQNSCIETGFIIERRTGGKGGFAQVGNTATGTQVLTDGGLTANTAFQYRVRATGAGRSSAFSNVINVRTLP